MARREVRCLGTAVIIAAALSAALIWARLPSAEAITDPSSWGVEAQDDGAGAPGGRAGLGGASPPGARARLDLEGASPPPGARERPGGASPPGARARPDGAPLPPGARGRPDGVSPPGARVDLDSASLGAGARPGGTSPPAARGPDGGSPPPAAPARSRPGDGSPPGTRVDLDSASLRAGARPGGTSPTPTARRPDGAPPPPAARGGPGGGSPTGARIRLYGARGQPGGPSTAAVRAWPEVASSAPGAYVRSACSSPDGGAPVSGTSPSPCPCKDNTSHPSGKPKPAPEHHQTTAGAVPPPPTPPEDKPAEKRIISRAMLVLGCLYSLLSFCTPIITFWSTARSVEATYAFHGWFDLFASALGSFGWLLFSISQLHGEDGQIIGTAAIVVNAFGFAFYATYIVVKLAVAGYMGTRACLSVMLVFLGAYISAIMISVYGPMKRESRAAKIVSIVAFAVQIISQSIPLFTVCPLLWSMILPPQNEQRPENINTRKLTVYSRVGNFGLSLFWVSYCSMTYEHDFFQLANDVGAVLSFASMVLHLVYTLHPHAVDYPPAAAALGV